MGLIHKRDALITSAVMLKLGDYGCSGLFSKSFSDLSYSADLEPYNTNIVFSVVINNREKYIICYTLFNTLAVVC